MYIYNCGHLFNCLISLIQHYFLYTGNAESNKPVSSNQVAFENKNSENEKCFVNKVGLALLNIKAIILIIQKGESPPCCIFFKGEITYMQLKKNDTVSYMLKYPFLQRFLQWFHIYKCTKTPQWNYYKFNCATCKSGHTHFCFWQDLVKFQLFFPWGSALGSVPSALQWIHKWHEKGSTVRWQHLLMILSYSQ